jgi:hypothetical protein
VDEASNEEEEKKMKEIAEGDFANTEAAKSLLKPHPA